MPVKEECTNHSSERVLNRERYINLCKHNHFLQKTTNSCVIPESLATYLREFPFPFKGKLVLSLYISVLKVFLICKFLKLLTIYPLDNARMLQDYIK